MKWRFAETNVTPNCYSIVIIAIVIVIIVIVVIINGIYLETVM